MSQTIEIKFVVDAPLEQYFDEGLRWDHVHATSGKLRTDLPGTAEG